MLCSAAPRRSSCRKAPRRRSSGTARGRGRRPAAATCAHRRALLRRAAGRRRRRDRHQRQDVGRVLRPPALGAAWATAPRASALSAWSDRQARKFSPTLRLTRSSFTASSPISPSAASPISPSKRRAMGSSSAASTACGLPPAPSPTSRATISTITRASRPISTRSSACSANCCRLAPAPSSMWTPRPVKKSRRLPNRAASQ